MEKNSPNILIYRLGSLGDTVMALPCFHQIRRTFPASDTTLLTNKPVASTAAPLEAILGKDQFFDRTLTYPVGTRNPLLLSKLLLKIKAQKIETVINITALRSQAADLRDKKFFQLAGIKNFIGFDASPADYEVSIDPNTGEYEWEAERLARKINALGPIDLGDKENWDFCLSDTETRAAEKLLSPLPDLQKIIVLNCGTKMPVKDWGENNWTELISQLSRSHAEYTLVVIGVREENERAEAILKRWHGLKLNLCGKSSPRVSAAVLEKAKLFIGHDSGPMHLAGAIGLPCVAVFACINQPKQWFPRGDHNTIIFPDTACAKNPSRDCQNPDRRCVLTISPLAVAQAIDTVLQDTVAQ